MLLLNGIVLLVENYRPTVAPRAGLGFDALREVNPRLIYAQLSGLGYDGRPLPYAGGGFDLIAQSALNIRSRGIVCASG
jgi:crotonobetainyl-CoA:carnitine CoA-transferase CaiB-like acyl-CoA transferase